MQIIKNKTNIDFIGKRKVALFLSTAVNVAILVGIAAVGFNWGIDFVGGTVVELQFKSTAEKVDAEAVRKRAEAGGLHDVSVQGIGAPEEQSFLVRLGGTTQLTRETAEAADAALKNLGGDVKVLSPDLDNGILNFRSPRKLEVGAVQRAVAGTMGVKEVREVGEVAGQFEYQVVASGMAEKITQAMSVNGGQEFEVRRTEYVGPQVGKQLQGGWQPALRHTGHPRVRGVPVRLQVRPGGGARHAARRHHGGGLLPGDPARVQPDLHCGAADGDWLLGQ
jgi:preprotein translocase subunit SecF